MVNYYEILGVNKDVNNYELKKAYRKLAKMYHPDTNNNENSDEIFKLINNAYEILSNEVTRKNYDYELNLNSYSNKNFSEDNSYNNTEEDDDIHNNKKFTITRKILYFIFKAILYLIVKLILLPISIIFIGICYILGLLISTFELISIIIVPILNFLIIACILMLIFERNWIHTVGIVVFLVLRGLLFLISIVSEIIFDKIMDLTSDFMTFCLDFK